MISLGVDIGGTGCKCVAFHEDGTQLAISYLEYPNPSGNVNLDAGVLREAVFSVIETCVKELPDKGEVAAITVSSFGESFVPVDRTGKPLTEIILYFANSESEDFEHLVQTVGVDVIMDTTRVLPDASYSLSKMLHTQRNAVGEVWKYLFVASYLSFCLSGEAVCDESLACRSLLYNVKQHSWSEKLLKAAGIRRDQLPEVKKTGAVTGTLLPALADRFGLKETVKIINGCHDQIVNALGAGVCSCGEAVDTTGTCECITPLFAQIPGLDIVKDNYACVPYLDGRGYVTYAYNVSAGSVVKWYRDTLTAHLGSQAEKEGCSIYELLNRTCPKKPTELLVLPFLQGMGGTPDVDPTATGLVAGLTTNTKLPHLYRAILEGLCFEMLYNLEKLEAGGIKIQRLYACGGGARSDVWLQIKADVWGREIVPVKTEETGALGSAILGFAAVNGVSSVCDLAKNFVRHREFVQPNPENHAYYQKKYEKYKLLRAFYQKF